MKIIKYLNTFAISLPFIIALIGLIDGSYYGTALVSTMLTGFIQVVLALLLLSYNPLNKYLHIYFITVLLFFALWYLNANTLNSDVLTFILFPIPLLLTAYLSYIIYKKDTL